MKTSRITKERFRYFGRRRKSYSHPKGRNVLLQKQHGTPHITKDGVSVTREIELEDTFEDMGAQLVKEVSQRTTDITEDRYNHHNRTYTKYDREWI